MDGKVTRKMITQRPLLFATAFVGACLLILYLFEREGYIVTPLGQIVGSGLAAAICAQAIVWWKDHSRDEKTLKRDRQFAAIQLAVGLERYAIECAMRISEIDRRLEESYQTGSFAFALPRMPKLTLPDAGEWRWIATDLTSEVLSLAPKISFSDGSIEFTLDYAGLHDGAEEAQRQLGSIGYEAWTLAAKVRNEHNISPQAYILGEWKFVDTLNKYA